MLRLKGMRPATFALATMAAWRPSPCPTHVFVCVADHFEPNWHAATPAQQKERVARWMLEYGRSVEAIEDSRGRRPQHTFFYPVECYDASLIDDLTQLVRGGYGDIEVHLHHEDDNADRLREFLNMSVNRLHDKHGLLSSDSAGNLRYGFIHGNWALDNSHPQGRWCGVNNELTILRETGCYADFTMPAAPHGAQTQTINSIYYAVDDPDQPKSHDRGVAAAVGVRPPASGLLMIQGPLLVSQRRPWSKPTLENGNLAALQPPTGQRLVDWLKARVTVKHCENWSFIKLHTHGAPEANADVLLGKAMRRFHQSLSEYASQCGFQYYYVTAREMAQLVAQAEHGLTSPNFDTLGWL